MSTTTRYLLSGLVLVLGVFVAVAAITAYLVGTAARQEPVTAAAVTDITPSTTVVEPGTIEALADASFAGWAEGNYVIRGGCRLSWDEDAVQYVRVVAPSGARRSYIGPRGHFVATEEGLHAVTFSGRAGPAVMHDVALTACGEGT